MMGRIWKIVAAAASSLIVLGIFLYTAGRFMGGSPERIVSDVLGGQQSLETLLRIIGNNALPMLFQ